MEPWSSCVGAKAQVGFFMEVEREGGPPEVLVNSVHSMQRVGHFKPKWWVVGFMGVELLQVMRQDME